MTRTPQVLSSCMVHCIAFVTQCSLMFSVSQTCEAQCNIRFLVREYAHCGNVYKAEIM